MPRAANTGHTPQQDMQDAQSQHIYISTSCGSLSRYRAFPGKRLLFLYPKMEKIMNIEKLSSGSYRITQMYKGKRYRVTVDHKPSKFEAQRLITEKVNDTHIERPGMYNSFDAAAKAYIDERSHVLSISTIRGYVSILRNLPDTFKSKDIHDLMDGHDIQTLMNEYARNHSPKSVRNMHSFIAAVIHSVVPSVTLPTRLPQPKRSDAYIPEDEDVQALLKAITGTEYEIPIMLACFGLRRSEICALDISDFDFEENTVRIHKAKLRGLSGMQTVERNKTTESTRTVYISSHICDKVKEKGYVYKGHPNEITKYMHRTLKKIGLEDFSLHKLRHYYASMASAAHMGEEYIMEQGGWSTPYVMKRIYRHAQEDKKKKNAQLAIDHMNNILSGRG